MKRFLFLSLFLFSDIALAGGPCIFGGQYVKCFPSGGIKLENGQGLTIDQGALAGTLSFTDAAAVSGIFSAQTRTTVDGSNNAIGLQLSATSAVDSGAYNDKATGAFIATVARGSGPGGDDEGHLDSLVGAQVLIQLSAGTSSQTDKVYGLSSAAILQHGNVTDNYGVYSIAIPAGDAVITNNYGLYIDNAGPVATSDWGVYVKGGDNWLKSNLKIGGSAGSTDKVSSATIAIETEDKSTLLKTTGVTDAALILQAKNTAPALVQKSEAGTEIFNRTDDGFAISDTFTSRQYQFYSSGYWAKFGVGAFLVQGPKYFDATDPSQSNAQALFLGAGTYATAGTPLTTQKQEFDTFAWNGSDGSTFVSKAGFRLTQLSAGYDDARFDLFTAAAETPRMSILSDGKVGIGTITPTQTLDVVGTTKVTDAGGAGGNVPHERVRRSSTTNTSATCSVSCSAGETVTGGGCQNSLALNMADNYPSADDTWSCEYTLATGNCTAWAVCFQY